MATFEFDTTIARPPDEVFAYLVDFDRQPEWQPGVLSSTHSPAGPPRVGTRVRKVRKMLGRQVAFTDEITVYDPATRTYAERVIDSWGKGSGSQWQVDAAGDGARLRVSMEIHGHGLGRLLQPVILAATRQDLQSMMTTVKAILESRR